MKVNSIHQGEGPEALSSFLLTPYPTLGPAAKRTEYELWRVHMGQWEDGEALGRPFAGEGVHHADLITGVRFKGNI